MITIKISSICVMNKASLPLKWKGKEPSLGSPSCTTNNKDSCSGIDNIVGENV